MLRLKRLELTLNGLSNWTAPSRVTGPLIHDANLRLRRDAVDSLQLGLGVHHVL
jgi:hypothetical protein